MRDCLQVHNENKQRTFTSQIALLQKEVAKLEAEETRLADETRSLMEAAAHLRKERQLALHDTDLQLRLKAGQVESEPPELVSSDLSVARFVHRSIVEGLNEAVHVRGGKKMEILTAIKDFKKGIYQLEWEQKKWVPRHSGRGQGTRGQMGRCKGCGNEGSRRQEQRVWEGRKHAQSVGLANEQVVMNRGREAEACER